MTTHSPSSRVTSSHGASSHGASSHVASSSAATSISNILDQAQAERERRAREAAEAASGKRAKYALGDDEVGELPAEVDTPDAANVHTTRFKLATWATMISIAVLPAYFVPVQVYRRETVPLPVLVLAGLFLSVFSVRGSVAATKRLLAAAPLFWVCNAAYLVYLAAASKMLNSDAPPQFFINRLAILAGTFAMAVHVARMAEARLFRERSLQIALLGMAATGAFFAAAARRVGLTPGEFFSLATGGNGWAYARRLQLTLSSFYVDGGASGGETEVFKNPVGEGLALMAIVAAAAWPRVAGQFGKTLRFAVLGALTLGVLLTLSRSSALGLFVAYAFLFWRWLMSDSRRAMNLVAMLAIGVGFIGAMVATSPETGVDLFRDRVSKDRSIESREMQFVQATTESRSMQEILFGGGPDFVFDKQRVHNLLLSSWIEGGLIALGLVLMQFGSLGWAVLRVVSRNDAFRDERVTLALGMVGVLFLACGRTMVAGGGGYYTIAGLAGAALFLGCASPVLRVRSRDVGLNMPDAGWSMPTASEGLVSLPARETAAPAAPARPAMPLRWEDAGRGPTTGPAPDTASKTTTALLEAPDRSGPADSPTPSPDRRRLPR